MTTGEREIILSVRVSDDELRAIKKRCRELRISVNKYINLLLQFETESESKSLLIT